jgi:hypothetical protein
VQPRPIERAVPLECARVVLARVARARQRHRRRFRARRDERPWTSNASFDADDASRDGARATRRRSNERPRRRAVARAASGTDDEPPAPLYVKIPLGFAYAALTYAAACNAFMWTLDLSAPIIEGPTSLVVGRLCVALGATLLAGLNFWPQAEKQLGRCAANVRVEGIERTIKGGRREVRRHGRDEDGV